MSDRRCEGVWWLQVNKVWVHEGRFYNYAKPGAVEYSSTQGAQAALNAAKAAADAIHGLGKVRPHVQTLLPLNRASRSFLYS